MPNDRVYRENIRIAVAYPEAFANFATPLVSELNATTFVKDITCALDEDGSEISLGDPDTDDSLSFCDAAGTQTATFKNPSVTLVAFRDEDRSATGYMDTAFQHLAFPDVPLITILRVGYDSDVAFAAGQRINLVGGKTDLPVSVEESGTNARISNTILPDGTVNWGYVVAS
jgi:hypothetical protein